MKTTHQLAAELLALPDVRIVTEGWLASTNHEPAAVMTSYDPQGTAIIMQKSINQTKNQTMNETLAIPVAEILMTKTLRVELDVPLQKLKAQPPSRERALAITRLQEAIMWLGMDLKRLGTPNPYPNSRDTSNVIVDPTADGLKL